MRDEGKPELTKMGSWEVLLNVPLQRMWDMLSNYLLSYACVLVICKERSCQTSVRTCLLVFGFYSNFYCPFLQLLSSLLKRKRSCNSNVF